MKIKDQQYGIFLSSVDYPAVREYRLVAKAIVESDEFRHLWKPIEMGHFGTANIRSLDYCRDRVVECYIYVGLFGPIYGSVNETLNISYTEYEYNVAQDEAQRDSNFRVAVFVLPSNSILASMTEKDYDHHAPNLERQRQFKNRVNSEVTSRPVIDIDDFRKHFTTFMRSLKHPQETPIEPDPILPIKTLSDKLLAGEPDTLFDAQLVIKHGVEELEQELVEQFLQADLVQDDLRKKGALRQSRSRQLEALGLARNDHPTLGTFLCLAPSDLIMPYFPASGLELYVYDGLQRGGTARIYFDANHDNLLRLYDVGIKFFRTNAGLKRHGVVGSEARDDLEIPLLALREALANALVHRDYERAGEREQPTRIEIFSDRAEIRSFGGLVEGIDLRLLNEDPEKVTARRRYHTIARIFRYMSLVETRGGGVSTMQLEMAKRKLSYPLITLQDVNGFRSVSVRFLRPLDLHDENAGLVITDPPKIPSNGTSVRRKQSDTVGVMLSGTTINLADHRKAVIDSVWRQRMFPLAVEVADTSDSDAVSFSLSLVDQASVYILILGHRYGFRPEDEIRNPNRLSITELEYRRAVNRNIPIRIFVMSDDHPIKLSERETEPASENLLLALKDELKKRHIVSFFSSPQELAAQVYQSLAELKESQLLATQSVGTESTVESQLTLPSPPEPYVAHPYFLTQEFWGREKELSQIDEWNTSNDTTLLVAAIGGAGKSALIWEWFKRHADNFEGAFWWSFYESNSSLKNFTGQLLAYLMGKPLKAYEGMTQQEQEGLLLQELHRRRVLLVLDGLERLLMAYKQVDAARLSDEEASKVNGRDTIYDIQYLRMVSAPHGELLRKLTQHRNTKVLISTRLIPAELEDRSRKMVPGVRLLSLSGLDSNDAVGLMLSLGVYGDKTAILDFTTQFGNHPLLINLLAGRIREYRPAPGDFARWFVDEGRALKLASADLVKRHTGILQYALKGLKPELRRLLGQIAAFRFAVDYETLQRLNPYQSTQDGLESHKRDSKEDNYSLPRFHNGLAELEARGLLNWDRATNKYDLHPVVRRYMIDTLNEEE